MNCDVAAAFWKCFLRNDHGRAKSLPTMKTIVFRKPLLLQIFRNNRLPQKEYQKSIVQPMHSAWIQELGNYARMGVFVVIYIAKTKDIERAALAAALIDHAKTLADTGQQCFHSCDAIVHELSLPALRPLLRAGGEREGAISCRIPSEALEKP